MTYILQKIRFACNSFFFQFVKYYLNNGALSIHALFGMRG